jgi:hypothetical protein
MQSHVQGQWAAHAVHYRVDESLRRTVVGFLEAAHQEGRNSALKDGKEDKQLIIDYLEVILAGLRNRTVDPVDAGGMEVIVRTIREDM